MNQHPLSHLYGQHLHGLIRPSLKLAVLSSILLLACFSKPSVAQQADTPTLAGLRQQLNELSQSVASQPDVVTPELQSRIQALDGELQLSAESQKEINRLRNQLQNAELDSNSLEREIAWLKKNPPGRQDLSQLGINELDAGQTELQNEISQLQAKKRTLDESIASRDREREQIETELQSIIQKLEAARLTAQEIKPNATVSARLIAFENQTELLRLEQRQSILQLQQQIWKANEQFDLDRKLGELLTLQLDGKEAYAAKVNEAIVRIRQQAAQALATEANEMATEISQQYPALVVSEETNVEIAQEIQSLEKEAAGTTNEISQLKDQLADIYTKYRDTQLRIGVIGRSNTVGAMLRKRKSELPPVGQRQRQANNARLRIEEIQFNRFQTSERLAELGPDVIRQEIVDSGYELTNDEWKQLETPVQELIQRRKERLLSLDKLLDRLFASQLDIETSNSKVASVVDQFEGYINERIFWLRSNKVLFSEIEFDKADGLLLSPKNWQDLQAPATQTIKKQSFLFWLIVSLAGLLFILRPRMNQQVNLFGEAAESGSCTTIWPTTRASIQTILIAITIPGLIFGLGWLMNRTGASGNVLFDAVAHALLTAGMFAVPVEILRRACRPKGLGTNHFDWPDDSVRKLKRNLTWFVLPATLFVFAISLLVQLDTAHRVDLIERTLFVAGMLMTAWLLLSIFSPARGIFSQYLNRHQNSWANQTSSIWLTIVLLLPLSLAVLAFTGYYYTALNLTRYLCFTFAFAVAVELLRAFIRRFVLVRRRAAHVETARRKREAEYEAELEARRVADAERERRIAAGEDVGESTTPVMTSESLTELNMEDFDIDENAGQANQLIRLLGWAAWLIGFWLIWSDVLPAIKALDEYKLWGATTVVQQSPETLAPIPLVGMPASNAEKTETGELNANDSDPATNAVASTDSPETAASLFGLDTPTDDSVSLRDFLLFLAIVLLTFFAARNLPNAFEMLFLEQLPVDRSARYASKALFSYAIVIVGTVLALRTLSIQWTSIQWLVTALTFGLAFGLQEIFANFVAGIILMFERPMRIGDLITVDGFTGVVTRIRTRATTVVNWDRKEYVIPNKDFITGRLINWTLSDAINRIQFTVGVAYGSDVARAKKIIFDICRDHPSIVDDPPTSITFQEFSDSSLNLVVRTFLGEVNSRLPVIDALHSQINAAFEEAGIDIAFPQRDLNLRSIDESAAKYLVQRG